MFPRAVILHTVRDPADTCFSCYRQIFEHDGHVRFAYDLKALGRHYRAYRDMMDHSRTTLLGRVIDVRYESLVADFEGGCVACWTSAGSTGETPACASLRIRGRCTRPARTRCVSRSSTAASAPGGGTARTSARCSRRSAPTRRPTHEEKRNHRGATRRLGGRHGSRSSAGARALRAAWRAPSGVRRSAHRRDGKRRGARGRAGPSLGVQGHTLCCAARRTAALASAAAGRGLDRCSGRDRGRAGLSAGGVSRRAVQWRRLLRADQRGLPDPRRLRAGSRQEGAGDGVDLRRRQRGRADFDRSQRRPLLRPRRGGAGGDELPSGTVRLLRPPLPDPGSRRRRRSPTTASWTRSRRWRG